MSGILVLNGPNLNLLGTREPSIYGKDSLKSIEKQLVALATPLQYQIFFRQSNAEHTLVEWIHDAKSQGIQFILINPAAFTHTSVAIRDALLAVEIPFIEIHLSNVHAREPFRKHSYFSDIAQGVISGLGAQSYDLALRAAMAQLKK